MKILFRMTPKGAFYDGELYFQNHDFPFSRSDTIFKAILQGWKMLWGAEEMEKLVEQFKESKDVPFSVSSVFPVINNVFFLPRPFALRMESDIFSQKLQEQVSWISAAVYQKWLDGENIKFSGENFIEPGLYCLADEWPKINCSLADKKAWIADNRTRSYIEKPNAKASPYPCNRYYYSSHLDHYLVLDMNKDYQQKLESVFRLLADEGIGGQRSTGCGSFVFHQPEPVPEALDFINQKVEKSFVSLSLYHPTEKDIAGKLELSRYQVIERQGWWTDEQGKSHKQPLVRLFKEGSYFHLDNFTRKSLLEMKLESESTCCYHYVLPFRIAAPGV